MDNLLIMWIALAIVFAVIEALTLQVVTIWFAVGSLGAIIANVVNASPLVLVALSILTLVIARPYLKKFTKTKVQPTNADVCIGKQAIVTEEINNTLSTGQAKIQGVIWTARSTEDNTVIPEGATVTVKAIEGVKLIVAVD